MADLPKARDGPLEARWATMTPWSKVWADGADAQLFCQGVLYPPLAKEIYTTPSEALLDNAMKKILMHHHFTMGLIDRVRDSERVIDELSRLIDELRAEVRKLKDETGLVSVAANARASEATKQADESHHAARSKAREVEQLLATAQAAQKKAESSLVTERSAAPERARVTISQYKETFGFKFGMEKISRVSYEYGGIKSP
ncbi:hypothetical protein BHE74_00042281 [Ensete ventricosum]|nr:hypothetical protein BHE74_00042281 [Ensete ventricosum]